MQSTSEVKASFRLLVLASLLTLVLWFIPFAGVITYPISLFVTLIHEAGHALALLASFGRVNRIDLFWNGNGLTLGSGGWGLMTVSAGYLSTMLYGCGLLLALRRARNARGAAIFTAAFVLLITALFGGSLLTWITGLTFGGGCLLLGLKAKPKVTHFVMSFLAVQCVLNALYDLRVLLSLSASDTNVVTDAQIMAARTNGFIPAMVWALGWSALAVVMLGATLLIYYRSLRQRAALADPLAPALLTENKFNVAQPHQ